MEKYFLEEKVEKISLGEYFKEIEEQLDELKKKHSCEGDWKLESSIRDLSKKYVRVKHIYGSLGDVLITEDLIDVLCGSFDWHNKKYGTTVFKDETIKGMYGISEMFPELSKSALTCISDEYIRDLFDKYYLVESLAVLLRRDGINDATFEKYMCLVQEKAKVEDSKYKNVQWNIRIHYGHYPYQFVRHFEEFVFQHHIEWEQFCESVPSPEIFYKDCIDLKKFSCSTKDCWGSCSPISFQMLEDYLEGDTELSKFDEQPYYYVSSSSDKKFSTFTKSEFIGSIKEIHEVKKRKR